MKRQKLNVSGKEIKKHIVRMCSICGRNMEIAVYKDKTYRGGYYFFDVPLHTKKEMEKVNKAGTRTEIMGGKEVKVMRRDFNPHAYIEYWECPKCFRGAKDDDLPKPVLIGKKNMFRVARMKRA